MKHDASVQMCDAEEIRDEFVSFSGGIHNTTSLSVTDNDFSQFFAMLTPMVLPRDACSYYIKSSFRLFPAGGIARQKDGLLVGRKRTEDVVELVAQEIAHLLCQAAPGKRVTS